MVKSMDKGAQGNLRELEEDGEKTNNNDETGI
jgi:hypothetical protein